MAQKKASKRVEKLVNKAFAQAEPSKFTEYQQAEVDLNNAEESFLLRSGWKRHADFERNQLWVAPEFKGFQHISGTFAGDRLGLQRAVATEKEYRRESRWRGF